MKLLTKEIETLLEKHPFGSQDNTLPFEKKVLVKFFNPYGVGTWIIVEAEKQDDGDWLMFGLAEIGYGYEWGYVSFEELNELRVPPFGLPIERDKYLKKNCLVKDLVRESEMM